MRTTKIILLAITIFLTTSSAQAQPYIDSEDGVKPFIGTSAFVLFNVIPDDEPPAFAQLNFGLRLTPKDTISLELITWQYFRPLGIQYWQSGDAFPGKVRGFGIGMAYQRFLWRGAYAAIHATPFVQQYIDESGDVIQTGFQLFTTLRLGYHFSFFDDSLFIEPNLAITAWPVNTNLPDSFQKEEDRWAGYKFLEPGLHIGFNF